MEVNTSTQVTPPQEMCGAGEKEDARHRGSSPPSWVQTSVGVVGLLERSLAPSVGS